MPVDLKIVFRPLNTTDTAILNKIDDFCVLNLKFRFRPQSINALIAQEWFSECLTNSCRTDYFPVSVFALFRASTVKKWVISAEYHEMAGFARILHQNNPQTSPKHQQ